MSKTPHRDQPPSPVLAASQKAPEAPDRIPEPREAVPALRGAAPEPRDAAALEPHALDLARMLPGPAQDPRLAEGAPEVLTEVDSTNDELIRRLGRGELDRAGHLHALVTEHQATGHGRMGRSWTAPPRSAAVVSFVVEGRPEDRPDPPRHGVPGSAAPVGPGEEVGRLPAHALHWTTLLLALAGREAVVATTGLPAVLKWPNDVLVGGRKVSGVLARWVPADAVPAAGQDAEADVEAATGRGPSRGGVPRVVVGMGTNCNIAAEALPVPTATSLQEEAGGPVDRTALLAAVISGFRNRVRDLAAVDGDPARALPGGASLLEELRAVLDTLGRQVRVHRVGDLPDLVGTAVDIDAEARLLVDTGGADPVAVSVGDVVHLRPAPGARP